MVFSSICFEQLKDVSRNEHIVAKELETILIPNIVFSFPQYSCHDLILRIISLMMPIILCMNV